MSHRQTLICISYDTQEQCHQVIEKFKLSCTNEICIRGGRSCMAPVSQRVWKSGKLELDTQMNRMTKRRDLSNKYQCAGVYYAKWVGSLATKYLPNTDNGLQNKYICLSDQTLRSKGYIYRAMYVYAVGSHAWDQWVIGIKSQQGLN